MKNETDIVNGAQAIEGFNGTGERGFLDILPWENFERPEMRGGSDAAPDNLLSINLANLVEHQAFVSVTETVGRVYEIFQDLPHEYLAVTEAGQFVGLVAKGRVGFLLGSRRGYTVYGGQPIKGHLLEDGISVRLDTPIRAVMQAAFQRAGESFYDDVVLTDADGRFLGVIAFKTLVLLQARLMSEKQRFIESQHTELRQKNLELSQTVDELRRFRGRFGILFENSVLGVVLVNVHGDIEAGNARFEELFGDLPCNDRANLFDRVASDDRERLREAMARHLNGAPEEISGRREFQFVVRGDGRRLFEVFLNQIGETGQVCVILNDVTEHQAMSRRLAQREKAEMIECLAGGIAHEINNKITPILASAELLCDELGSERPEIGFYAQVIKESAIDAAKIIRQLLQLNRPMTSEFVHTNLATLVEESLRVLRIKARETGTEIQFDRCHAHSEILAEPLQIRQLILNLSINAMDAMRESGVRRLNLSISKSLSGVVLRVADTGHGIPQHQQNRIFDPFFTTKGPDRGTGLGLTVCLNIVKSHGGEIAVERSDPTGTTFAITFPAVTSNSKHDSIAPAETAPAATRSARYEKLRILVVDDEAYVAELLQRVLQNEFGCMVECAANGHSAATSLSQTPCDLVLSDLRMPEMDGLLLFKCATETHPHLSSRFIFMTGDAITPDMRLKLNALGVPILHKPFQIETVVKQCLQVLENAEVFTSLPTTGRCHSCP